VWGLGTEFSGLSLIVGDKSCRPQWRENVVAKDIMTRVARECVRTEDDGLGVWDVA
jgi:hypothetical protein